jgi:hypothetical protein
MKASRYSHGRKTEAENQRISFVPKRVRNGGVE